MSDNVTVLPLPADADPDFVAELTSADFALRREPLDNNLAAVHLTKV